MLKFTDRLPWITLYTVPQTDFEMFNLLIFYRPLNLPCRILENIWRRSPENYNCPVFSTLRALDINQTIIYISLESWFFLLSSDIFCCTKKYFPCKLHRVRLGAFFELPKCDVNSRFWLLETDNEKNDLK